jgi:hypothetical protein
MLALRAAPKNSTTVVWILWNGAPLAKPVAYFN